MVQVVVPFVLLANGLAAGVLLWSVLGGVPLLLSLPAQQYVEVERFWGNRFEPFQPICVMVTVLCDAVLTLLEQGPARLLFAGAAVCAAVVIVISLARNVPIKRWVMALDPRNLPDDWERRDPRAQWARWNFIRAGFAMVAFVLNTIAVTSVLPY